MNRRDFIVGAAAAAGMMQTGEAFAGNVTEMRAALLHFGTNMWQKGKHLNRLDFDEQVWRRLTARMVERGFNTIVIDLGEGLRYPSHPELAVEGSWDVARFRTELARLRKMGLEPIPKLNFSETHNAWMGVYRRMVGTKKYYQVVDDLIGDAIAVFDKPRLLHIGMDEEVDFEQFGANFELVIVRQGELFWRDLNYMVKCVEKRGVRAWMWADEFWTEKKDFPKNVPKSVLLSNGYYRDEFDLKTMKPVHRLHLVSFEELDGYGYDQVPCTSTCRSLTSVKGVVAFTRKVIAPERLKGFIVCPWEYSIPYGEPKCMASIDALAETFR